MKFKLNKKRKIASLMLALMIFLNNTSFLTLAGEITNENVVENVVDEEQVSAEILTETFEEITEEETTVTEEETTVTEEETIVTEEETIVTEEETIVTEEETTVTEEETIVTEEETIVTEEETTVTEEETIVTEEETTEEISSSNSSESSSTTTDESLAEKYGVSYEDLNIEVGTINYSLTEGITYDKTNYTLGILSKGGFDIDTIGSYTVKYFLWSYEEEKSVFTFERTVNVIERTQSEVTFILPVLKVEKDAEEYDLLEGAEAYNSKNEKLQLYIKDLADFDISQSGIYEIIIGVEEYQEFEGKRIVVVTSDDIKVTENKYNVLDEYGNVTAYDSLTEVLSLQEEELEVVLSGEYSLTVEELESLTNFSNNKLIIRGKDFASLYLQDSLNLNSNYVKLENLILEFSTPSINSNSFYLNLANIKFVSDTPVLTSKNYVELENINLQEVISDFGVVYIKGEVNVNNQITGFKQLKIGGYEEVSSLTVPKVETVEQTEEELVYSFSLDEIANLEKTSINTLLISVNLNSEKNKVDNSTGNVFLEGNGVLTLTGTGSTINKLEGSGEENAIFVSDSEEAPITLSQSVELGQNIRIGIIGLEEILASEERVKEINEFLEENSQITYPIINLENDAVITKTGLLAYEYEEKAFDYTITTENFENSTAYFTITQSLGEDYIYIMSLSDNFFAFEYGVEELKKVYSSEEDLLNKESYDNSYSLSEAIKDFINKHNFRGNNQNGNNNLVILINKNREDEEGNLNLHYLDDEAIEVINSFGSDFEYNRNIDSPRVIIAGTGSTTEATLSADTKLILGNEENLYYPDALELYMNADLILKNIDLLLPSDVTEQFDIYMKGHNFTADEGVSATALYRTKEEILEEIINGTYEQSIQNTIDLRSEEYSLSSETFGISVFGGTGAYETSLFKNREVSITIDTERFLKLYSLIGGGLYGDLEDITINVNNGGEISKLYGGNTGYGNAKANINISNGKFGITYGANARTLQYEYVGKSRFSSAELYEESETSIEVNYNGGEYETLVISIDQSETQSTLLNLSAETSDGDTVYEKSASVSVSNITADNLYFEDKTADYVTVEVTDSTIGEVATLIEGDFSDLHLDLNISNNEIETFLPGIAGSGLVENSEYTIVDGGGNTIDFTFVQNTMILLESDEVTEEDLIEGDAYEDLEVAETLSLLSDIILDEPTLQSLEENDYSIEFISTLPKNKTYDYYYDIYGNEYKIKKVDNQNKQTNVTNLLKTESKYTVQTLNSLNQNGYKIIPLTVTSVGNNVNVIYLNDGVYDAAITSSSNYKYLFQQGVNIFYNNDKLTIWNLWGGQINSYYRPNKSAFYKSTGSSGGIIIIKGQFYNIFGGSLGGGKVDSGIYSSIFDSEANSGTTTEITLGNLILILGGTFGSTTNYIQNSTNFNSDSFSESDRYVIVGGGGNNGDFVEAYNSKSDYRIASSTFFGASTEGRVDASHGTNIRIYGGTFYNYNIFGGSYYGYSGATSSNSVAQGNVNIEISNKDSYTIGGYVQNGTYTPDALSLHNVDVYGGNVKTTSESEKGLLGDINISIKNISTSSTNAMQDTSGFITRVYGGHGSGNTDNVGGKITINIGELAVIKSGIYGGNAGDGNVGGGTEINIESTEAYTVLANGHLYGGNAGSGNITGGTKITLTSGNIYGSVYGGNAGDGSVAGGTEITSKAAVAHGRDIYGGNLGTGKVDTVKIDFYASKHSYLGSTVMGPNIYAGNALAGSSAMTIDSTEINIYDGAITSSIHGGNGAPNGSASVTVTKSNIKIYGGTINGDVYGGSAGVEKLGTSNISILPSAGKTITITGDVFGGNKVGEKVTGSSISEKGQGTDTSNINILTYEESGTGTVNINGNIYGGNNRTRNLGTNNGSVGTSNINISNVTLNVGSNGSNGNIYGGNNSAEAITISSNISISGSSTTVTLEGNIYGGNAGNSGTKKSNITIKDNPTIYIKGGAIYGGTYGTGNQEASVSLANITIESTNLYSTDTSSYASIYGGSLGKNNPLGTSVISVSDSAVGNIYGGNGIGGGSIGNSSDPNDENVKITVQGGAVYGDIHGGNEGGSEDSGFGSIFGKISIQLSGGVKVYGSVYGGSKSLSGVGAGHTNENGHTEITINGTYVYIYGSVYGGHENGSSATNVNGYSNDLASTKVTINGAKISENVYGGNKEGNINIGSTTVNFGTNYFASSGNYNGSRITGNVYGGSGGSGDVGSTNINIEPGYPGASSDKSDTFSAKNIYGGNAGTGNVTESTTITINGSINPNSYTIAENIYGGNYGDGDVGSTTIKTGETSNSAGYILASENVYGGNYGGGSVTGDTNISVEGSAASARINIAGNVYGGNAGTGDVEGTTSVSLVNSSAKSVYGGNGNNGNVGTSGTTDNVKVTNVTINSTNLSGSVYGGSSGSGNIYGKTYVYVIGGGTISGDVYGGSENSTSSTNITSTELDLQGAVTTISGNVYGGHSGDGNITGAANVGIQGVKITGNIYGGNKGNGSIGSASVITGYFNGNTSNGTTISGSVYGGNAGSGNATSNTSVDLTGAILNGTNSSIYGGNTSGNVEGNTSVALTSVSTVTGDVYGGNETSGTISGTSTVTVNNEDVTSPEFKGNVYGGSGGTGITTSTNVTLTGQSAGDFAVGNVYGGNNNGDVTTSTYVKTSGVKAGNVYGGNANGGAVGSSISDANKKTISVELTSTQVSENVYGGSGADGAINGYIELKVVGGSQVSENVYGGSETINSLINKTDVTIQGAGVTISGNVYGGSKSGSGGVSTPNVSINSGTVTNVYGGNASESTAGITEGTITLSYNNGAPVIKESIYGGNEGSGPMRTTTITINSGTISGNVYGGHALNGNIGEGYTSQENVKISVSGADINGNIYGGSKGGSNVYGTTSISVTSGTVDNIYGGNESDTTDENGNTTERGSVQETKIEVGTATVNGSIYGGNGESNSGEVGNTSVTITNTINPQGTATSVYGGNHGSGAVTGDARVYVSEGVTNDNLPLYGGNAGSGAVEGSSTVTIQGTNNSAVYGGNAGSGDNASSNVIIEGSNNTEVYGGNYGNGNATNTSVTVGSSGHVGNEIYGGNYGGGEVTETSTVNIHGRVDGGVDGGIYAGNGGTGNANVKDTFLNIYNGATVFASIFGGNSNNGGNVTGTATVTIGEDNAEEGVYATVGAWVYGGNAKNQQNGDVANTKIILKPNAQFVASSVSTSISPQAGNIIAGNRGFGNLGTSEIIIEGNTNGVGFDRIYGGNQQLGSVENVTITVNDANVNYIYGGNYYGSSLANSTLTQEETITIGNVTIDVTGSSEVKNIYGLTDSTSSLLKYEVTGDIKVTVISDENKTNMEKIYLVGYDENDNITTSVTTQEGVTAEYSLTLIGNVTVDSVKGYKSTSGSYDSNLLIGGTAENSINTMALAESISTLSGVELYSTENSEVTIKSLMNFENITIKEGETFIFEPASESDVTLNSNTFTMGDNSTFEYSKNGVSISSGAINVNELTLGKGITIKLPSTTDSEEYKPLKITVSEGLSYNEASEESSSDKITLELSDVSNGFTSMATGRGNKIIQLGNDKNSVASFKIDSTGSGTATTVVDQSAFNNFVKSITLGSATSSGAILSGLSLTGNLISESTATSNIVGDGSLGVYFGYDTTLQVSVPTKLLFIGVYDLFEEIHSPEYTITNNSENLALKVEVIGFEESGTSNQFTINKSSADESDESDESDNEKFEFDLNLKITGTEGFSGAEDKLLYTVTEDNSQRLGVLTSTSEGSNEGKFTITGSAPIELRDTETGILRSSFITKFRFTPLTDANDENSVVESSRLE